MPVSLLRGLEVTDGSMATTTSTRLSGARSTLPVVDPLSVPEGVLGLVEKVGVDLLSSYSSALVLALMCA